jgi:hypothetical protein
VVMLYLKDVAVQCDLVLYGFRELWMVITDHFRYNTADKHENKFNFIIIKLY